MHKTSIQTLLGGILGVCVLSACQSWPVTSSRPTTPGALPGDATVSGRPFNTFTVYSDQAHRGHYAPSGYMGDSDLTMSGAYIPTHKGEGPCLRVNYRATGSKGWAGIFWQDPANNWGDIAGRSGYDLRGATRMTFWAKGENGGEKVHEFRVGGIVGPYPDSDAASIGPVRLTREWKRYTIDLTGKDLRHIIGGFGFFVNRAENPAGANFYLNDIIYEGVQGTPSAGALPAMSTTTVTLPIEPVAPPAPPAEPKVVPLPPPSKDMRITQMQQGLRVSFTSQMLFTPSRAVLGPDSGKVLGEFIELLKAYPGNSVLIEGHTDATGNAEFNLKLSRLRADSVRDHLIKQGGFQASRFRTVGYGDTRPVADNATKTGRALNRRVEITILKNAP